jgi:hypothetical protein
MDAVKNVASDALGLAKDAPKEIKRGAEEAHSGGLAPRSRN